MLNAASALRRIADDALAIPGRALELKGANDAEYADILAARADFDFRAHWAQRTNAELGGRLVPVCSKATLRDPALQTRARDLERLR